MIEGSRLFLLPLAAVLATLSLTRDNGWVLVAALLVYAAVRRSRNALLAAGVGAAAIVPAHLDFPIDSASLAAFTVNGSRIPPSNRLSFVAGEYGGAFREMLESQWGLQGTGLPSVTGVVLLAGLLGLVLPALGREPLVGLARATVLGGALFVLTLPQPGYRILFVLLPSAAVGYGLLFTVLGRFLSARLRTRSQPGAPG